MLIKELRSKSVSFLYATALLFSSSCDTQALPSFETSVYSQLSDSFGDTQVISETLPTPIFGANLQTATDDPSDTKSSVNVDASVKAVKASGEASGAGAVLTSSFSLIQVSYGDTFVMDAFDDFGNPVFQGLFTATANFSGTVTASGSGAFSSFARGVGSVSVLNGTLSRSVSGTAVASSLGTNFDVKGIGASLQIVVPWIAGQPISLSMSAVVEVDGYAGTRSSPFVFGEFSSEADLSSTVAWGGITDVVDMDGNPVASFSAFNLDGDVNYATAYNPVPLPAAVWFLGAGMFALFRLIKRSGF